MHSLGCAEVTNIPKTSEAYNYKVYFLLTPVRWEAAGSLLIVKAAGGKAGERRVCRPWLLGLYPGRVHCPEPRRTNPPCGNNPTKEHKHENRQTHCD